MKMNFLGMCLDVNKAMTFQRLNGLVVKGLDCPWVFKITLFDIPNMSVNYFYIQ